jgi:hypothetical protein
MEARTSRAVTGLPTILLRDRKRQYRRKPFRCQRTTVSGFTIRRGFDHFGPHLAQYYPEQSVGTAQARPLGSAFQYNQLLPQGDDFEPQVMTRPNKASQPREQTQDQPMHESVLITRQEGALVVDPPDCVLTTYSRRDLRVAENENARSMDAGLPSDDGRRKPVKVSPFYGVNYFCQVFEPVTFSRNQRIHR